MALKPQPMLQDDQHFALMKFRRSVADILKPEHDDYYLLRWLRARSWNPDAAEKMLRDSVKWRERWGTDEISTWDPPKILQDYLPHGVSGYDKDGAIFIVIPFAGMDMYGLLHTVSRNDIIRITMKYLESYMKEAFDRSQKYGNNARQFVVLFDMEGFNIKQYAWRPAGEVVISLIKMYEANYPEILKSCYIINVPRVFAFAFNIVKKFLDEYTLSKIFIYKSDRKKWLPALLENIDASQLPKYYGGEMVDTNNNDDPKCAHKISWGGKVPKEMYTDKCDDHLNNNDTFKEVTIKKGHKLKLEFNCADSGCFLKWDFKTYEHDIKFGVRCLNQKTQEVTDEVPIRRVASHQCDEDGFITCQPNCKYTVVFDNSYSYLRNKKLYYSVLLTTPLSEIEKGANEIVDVFEENNTQTQLDTEN